MEESSRAFAAVLALSLLTSAACTAAVSPNREAFIRAHEHGWVELRVVDDDVPLPEGPGSEEGPEPPVCRTRLTLNEEPFLDELLYPFGKAPPYRLETGFRFPVSAGLYAAVLSYSSCDGLSGRDRSVRVTVSLDVNAQLVTPLFFDGVNLIVEPQVENDAMTLDRVYEKLVEFRLEKE